MTFLDPHITRVTHFPNVYGSHSRGNPFEIGGHRTPRWYFIAVGLAVVLIVGGFALSIFNY